MAKIFKFESQIMRTHNNHFPQLFFIPAIISLSLECDSRLSQWFWDNDSVLPDGTKWSCEADAKTVSAPLRRMTKAQSNRACLESRPGRHVGTQVSSSKSEETCLVAPPISLGGASETQALWDARTQACRRQVSLKESLVGGRGNVSPMCFW